MAKTPKLDNPTNLGLHLAAGLSDDFLSEAQYILDDTATEKEGKQISLQETIDNLQQTTNNWASNQDIDNMFGKCPHKNETTEDENQDDIEPELP